MKTAKEILSVYAITNHSGVEFVKPHNCIQAMEEYASQFRSPPDKKEVTEEMIKKEAFIFNGDFQRIHGSFGETAFEEGAKWMREQSHSLPQGYSREQMIGFFKYVDDNYFQYANNYYDYKSGASEDLARYSETNVAPYSIELIVDLYIASLTEGHNRKEDANG